MRRSVVTAALVVGLLTQLAEAHALEHRVRAGDTLSELARRYGTSVSAIRRANGLSDDLILVGQTLEIPVPGEARPIAAAPPPSVVGPPPPRASSSTHRVRSGESLALIAARNGITVAALRAVNGLRGDLIQPGQLLTVPHPSAQPRPALAPRPTLEGTSAAELEILARIVKGEAHPNGNFEGKVAVAAVVLNRVQDPRFPSTIQRVVHQPNQFSAYNRNNRNRLYWGPIPQWAWDAAREALRGADPTDGATHYFNPFLVRPRWARALEYVGRIGGSRSTAHDFFRLRDAARGPVAERGGAPSPGLAGRLLGDRPHP